MEVATKYLLKELKIDKELTTQEEIELWIKQCFEWQHKYYSQCSRMGGYKANVTKEIRKREKEVKQKELEIIKREEFLENNNYEKLFEREKEISNLENDIKHTYISNCKQLKKSFIEAKEQIIDELSKELIRWTEEYDVDSQKSQGYLVGINRAKKIIKEKMIFKLEEIPEFYKIQEL